MGITTKRTVIEPLKRDDFKVLLEMYFEPESNKYIHPLKDKNQDFYLQFLEKKMEANNKVVGFWIVKSKDTLEVIGTLNLNEFERLSITHVGCHLKRKFWNQGYGTELFSRIIQFGFEEMKLKEIYAIVDVQHIISERLLVKLGFLEDRIEKVGNEELRILKLKREINR